MKIVLSLLLAVTVVCAVVIYGTASQRSHESRIHLKTVAALVPASGPSADGRTPASTRRADSGFESDAASPRRAARGVVPSISPIRAAEIEWVGGQTIESLAADLGNAVIQSHRLSSDPVPSLIGYWHNAITRSPVALRLIEEGASHPDEVTRLLLHEANLAINEYPRARENLNNRVPQSTSLRDEHYRQTHRYQDAAIEWNRLHLEMYGAFYVIANLGRLKDDAKPTLASFLKLPLTNSYDCLDLKVWLIDAYFHQAKLEKSAFGERHRELVGSTDLFGPKVLRSRWNVPGVQDQSPLVATTVDALDLPTIEVLALPNRLTMKKPQKAAIIDNFLTYAFAESGKRY